MQAPSQDDLEGEASASKRPELEVLRLNRDLMDLNMKRYKAGYLPNLSGFLAHQYQLQRNNLFDSDEGKFNPITVIGLQLNVPIFDGFKKDANIQMAKIDATKVDIQIKQFTLATELEIRNARAMYLNASERLENQKKNLALAERILETTRLKYREGVGSSTEISTAEQELYRTQANYMNAIYDLVIAKTDLDKALGNPLK
ncbi:TolC family protein [Saprospira grandis]|uniref:TolC family protein n=1 Tax=Saprospira grandis TaxID=1008 RepID=UPI0022DD31CE|nr:TolC family protein [Saprospira grandis]WBM76294.1 TolC family protein [Saprospira grandis]